MKGYDDVMRYVLYFFGWKEEMHGELIEYYACVLLRLIGKAKQFGK